MQPMLLMLLMLLYLVASLPAAANVTKPLVSPTALFPDTPIKDAAAAAPEKSTISSTAPNAATASQPTGAGVELNTASEVGSIVGGICGLVALVISAVLLVKQVKQWKKEDEARHPKKWWKFWHRG